MDAWIYGCIDAMCVCVYECMNGCIEFIVDVSMDSSNRMHRKSRLKSAEREQNSVPAVCVDEY